METSNIFGWDLLGLDWTQNLNDQRMSLKLRGDLGLNFRPGFVQPHNYRRAAAGAQPDSHRDHPGKGHQLCFMLFLNVLDGWGRHRVIPPEKKGG